MLISKEARGFEVKLREAPDTRELESADLMLSKDEFFSGAGRVG